MSFKNKRNLLNNFIWYCSGLSIRELSSLNTSKSNYFGIGGINIFSTVMMLLLGTMSLYIAFPLANFVIYIFFGLVLSILSFIFNRQTINMLSTNDLTRKNQKHSLTLFPILLFSIFLGLLVSTPIKFLLFDIPANPSLFKRVKELHVITDSDLSQKITSWAFTLFVSFLALLPTIIQYYSLKSKLKNNRGSLLNELMWFCSGANKEIIRRCPNDHSKYFGIGGTILFTALMATLSGGYAFYTAFGEDGTTLSICFGLFWGAMIFNLDRFIVNTMYSDGKHSIGLLEILSGLPRIIIAIFLGIVISYPLEMKIFEDSINERLDGMQVRALIKHNKKLDTAYMEINTSKTEVSLNENTKNKYQNEIDIAFKEWDDIPLQRYKKYCYKFPETKEGRYECFYEAYPPEKKIKENRYYEIKARNEAEIISLKNKIAEAERNINDDMKEKKGWENQHTKTTIALDKLSARMKAFEEIKDDPEEKSTATASLFIMILLIIIETSPVFFKMMLSSGDYDIIVEAEKNEIKTRELVKISQSNDWANTEILKLTEENKKKVAEKQNELNTELNSNLELLSSIAKAQSEIAQVAIEKWKEEEIKKATENPEGFIKSNSNSNPST